jgi:hypothetical protein
MTEVLKTLKPDQIYKVDATESEILFTLIVWYWKL